MSAAIHAPIKWAQRKDSLYLTIAVSDLADTDIKLTENKLEFTGVSKESGEDKKYEANIEFFAEVDPADANSKYTVRPREVHFHIMKKDVEAEYWPRLLKDKATEKALPISADWSRYMDEDEEEEAKAAGAGGGGFDMSQFGGGAGGMNFADMMAGAGGAGGMPDMSALMGGAGGAGGMPDMSALMGGAGMPDMSALGGEGEGDSDDDEGAIPGLEGDAVPGSESSASGAQATGGN